MGDQPVVVLDGTIDVEQALKIFKRRCLQAGIFAEGKRREGYLSPGERKRLKSIKARAKAAKAARRLAAKSGGDSDWKRSVPGGRTIPLPLGKHRCSAEENDFLAGRV